MTEQQTITVDNRYDAKPGRDNYRTMVTFDPAAGTVEIFEFWGNGTPAPLWHRTELTLVSVSSAQWANVDDLVEYLESEDVQADLRAIAEGHSVEWDGSNHVGRLTENAANTLESLSDNLQGRFEHLPGIWEAGDWFVPAGFFGEKLLELIEGHGSLEEAVQAEVASALPEGHLDTADVREYFESQLKELVASVDEDEEDEEALEVVARAKKVLA